MKSILFALCMTIYIIVVYTSCTKGNASLPAPQQHKCAEVTVYLDNYIGESWEDTSTWVYQSTFISWHTDAICDEELVAWKGYAANGPEFVCVGVFQRRRIIIGE